MRYFLLIQLIFKFSIKLSAVLTLFMAIPNTLFLLCLGFRLNPGFSPVNYLFGMLVGLWMMINYESCEQFYSLRTGLQTVVTNNCVSGVPYGIIDVMNCTRSGSFK